MFGYINANTNELSEEQKNRYQSYSCGLCKELNRLYGKKGQLLLSYDMTFLVLLLTGLYEPLNVKEEFTCKLHPLKKKVSRVNEATEYAAKMNVLLSYQYLRDEWLEGGALHKRGYMFVLGKDYEQIKREYPRQAIAVEHALDKLYVAEQANETNIDAVAGIFGDMLAAIFNWKEDSFADELSCIGYYLGKFIYLMDAYDDLKEDEKQGKYNPFSYMRRQNMTDEELDTYARLIINSMMTECAKAFERLPIKKHEDLLANIIHSGVWVKHECMKVQ